MVLIAKAPETHLADMSLVQPANDGLAGVGSIFIDGRTLILCPHCVEPECGD